MSLPPQVPHKVPHQQTAVIVVDHGSRREESNSMLLEFAAAFAANQSYAIVEPAHMELAEPSIATAFSNCVKRGAKLVIISPYFLSPGRHWKHDIPRLAADAAAVHPGVQHFVTAPLALHPLMQQIVDDRIQNCLKRITANGPPCDVCHEGGGCRSLPDNV